MILAGGLVHLLVVSLPLLCLGVVHESYRDVAILAFVAGVSVLYAGDAATMRWKPSESRSAVDAQAKRWASVNGAALLMFFWVCLVERAVDVTSGSWLQLLGVALLFSGAILRALSVRTLGRDFRTEIDDVEGAFMRDGVYRFVRHPSETGLLAASLGAALLLQSMLGLVVWCGALVPVTLARLSLEERALGQRFGADYRRYADDVAGLMPLPRRRTRVRA